MKVACFGAHICKIMGIEDPILNCGSCLRFCRSADCRKCEVRKNKGWKVGRYRCRGCKRRFTHNPGFVGRHFPPHVITRCDS